ncbi:MAG TPA: porin [Woeseiaceae bacterium]|nr:porin [Woeseiaceae bacterium]
MGSNNQRLSAFVAALSLTMLLGAAPTAQAAWQIESEDGNSSIKFGFLAKLRGESIDPPVGSAEQNLFFRRLRILAGGKLNDKWSFFFETDSPNLGKETGGSKNHGDIFIQDFVVTYKPQSDAFMLDFGQILQAVTYNSNQSAVTLMATDYNPTSFVWAGALDTKVGRDYGVRARGYLMDDKLEYRASVLSGNRGADSTNSLRFFGRVMFNFFEPMKGLYYTGTTLGKKKLLSVGASVDTQEDYQTTSVDFFYDQPLGGNAFTIQGSWSNVDGDVFLTSLPDQENTTLEAGFYLGGAKLLPFVQLSNRDFSDPALADVDTFMIGVGYFFRGYNGNVKFSWGQSEPDGGESTDTIWLQLQAFTF